MAVFPEEDLALVMNIADRTVGPDEAADQIIRLHSCQGLIERFSHPRLIFRVHIFIINTSEGVNFCGSSPKMR